MEEEEEGEIVVTILEEMMKKKRRVVREVRDLAVMVEEDSVRLREKKNGRRNREDEGG